MDKYDWMELKDNIKSGAVVVVAFVVAVFVIFYLVASIVTPIDNNSTVKRCDILDSNGFETKIESYKVLGIKTSECYVFVNENYVPYDRFLSVEG